MDAAVGGGRGVGRGWRNCFRGGGQRWFAPFASQAVARLTQEPELGALKSEARSLERALGEIRRRMEELEPKSGNE
jgi:hypothetical protein